MVESDPGLWRWFFEHVATPLLSGMWAAMAYWINTISGKFRDMNTRQENNEREFRDKLREVEQHNADTYARRDDVREGFQSVNAKLDTLIKHALKGGEG